MAAHRYWRVYISAINGGSYAAVAGIAMATSVGGASVCSGGTASASSEYPGGYEATKAFDANSSTFWHGYASLPEWVKYDFGSGNDKDIVEFSVQSASSRASQAPSNFILQWSDDNAAWTSHIEAADQTAWGSQSTRTYTYVAPPSPGVPHRYWRLRITANNGRNYCGISRLQVRETPDGPDIIGDATLSASSTYSGYPVSNVADGDSSTFWHSNNNALPEWVSLDFGAGNEAYLPAIVITSRPADQYSGTDSPNTFEWQFSDNGSLWGTEFSVSGQNNWSTWKTESRRFTNAADVAGQIAYVNNASGYSAASVSSLASAAKATTTGNHLYVAVGWTGTDTTATVTDTAGNTYASKAKAVNALGNNCVTEWFECQNIIGNAANVATVSLGAAKTKVTIAQIEVDTDGALYSSGLAVSDDEQPATTSAFTTATSDLLLACSYITGNDDKLSFLRSTGGDVTPFDRVLHNTVIAVGYQKVYVGASADTVQSVAGSSNTGGYGLALGVIRLTLSAASSSARPVPIFIGM